MTTISQNLDVETDLVAFARQAVESCLKRVLAGSCKVKVPKLNGLMQTIPGMPFHSVPELFIQLAGKNSLELPSERFDLNPGQICVMPRGAPHRETRSEERR